MKNTKALVSALISASLLTIVPIGTATAQADEVTANNAESVYFLKTAIPFDNSLANRSTAFTASINEKLHIGGADYFMYPTFDNPDEALETIVSKAKTTLSTLSSAYNLGPLTPDNWEKYYEALNMMLDDDNRPEWYNESSDEITTLRHFFDIYENTQSNKEIKEALYATTINMTARVRQDTAVMQTLSLLLPDQTTLNNEDAALSPTPSNVRDTIKGFDVSKGVAYATKYATRPNNRFYKYFNGGDCANFASQILEAGGVSQINKYPDKAKGWWHVHDTSNAFETHMHSRSWTAAKTFAKYMGVTYKTRNNAMFSENIKKGDFIGADWESDGDCDHIGFITARASKKENGFYDYKVAQHTSNYNEWASSSENNWEIKGAKGTTYSRIRR